MAVIFLDVETTDLENGRVVQLAYKCSRDGRTVNELFRPPCAISYGSMAVHHITNEMVTDKPIFEESACKSELAELLKEDFLVAHNAPFDMDVLKTEGVMTQRYIDTLQVAKHVIESESYSLQFLRYFLGLGVAGTAHDALGDVLVLEALFGRLESLVREKFELSDEAELLAKMEQLTKMPMIEKFLKFGKYRGRPFAEIAEKDPGYLQWLFASESSKPEKEQSGNLILTLKTHLNVPMGF